MLKAKAEGQEDNVLPFTKPDTQDPKSDNWLRGLKLGTVFFARPKASQNFVLQEFQRGGDLPDTDFVFIRENLHVGGIAHYWVDSLGFSKAYRLIHIRCEGEDDESIVP